MDSKQALWASEDSKYALKATARTQTLAVTLRLNRMIDFFVLSQKFETFILPKNRICSFRGGILENFK